MYGCYWGLRSGSIVCVLVLIVKRVNDNTETADNAFLGQHTQEVALKEKGDSGDL
jgi:hypothetical protein